MDRTDYSVCEDVYSWCLLFCSSVTKWDAKMSVFILLVAILVELQNWFYFEFFVYSANEKKILLSATRHFDARMLLSDKLPGPGAWGRVWLNLKASPSVKWTFRGGKIIWLGILWIELVGEKSSKICKQRQDTWNEISNSKKRILMAWWEFIF